MIVQWDLPEQSYIQLHCQFLPIHCHYPHLKKLEAVPATFAVQCSPCKKKSNEHVIQRIFIQPHKEQISQNSVVGDSQETLV